MKTNPTLEWDGWKEAYDAEMAKLYEAAKQEGQVVMYMNQPESFQNNFPVEFNKHYPGITLQFVNGQISELLTRIKEEQSAGKFVSDLHGSGSSVIRMFCQDDRYESYIPPAVLEPGVKWLVDPLVDKDDPTFKGKAKPLAISMLPAGVVINTNLVPPEKFPKSYKDLLDPWWRGKVVMADTRIPGGENAMFLGVKKLYGLEFWDEFYREVRPAVITGNGAPLAARGEYHASLGQAKIDGLTDLEGTPIIWLHFDEGCTSTIYALAMIKGAPHPNAAKLLLNYIFSREGQAEIARYASRPPVRSDVHPANPLCDYSNVEFLPACTVEEDLLEKPQARDEAREIMARYGYK